MGLIPSASYSITVRLEVPADGERHANYIVPSVFHPDLASTVAAAVSSAVSSATE